MWKCMPNKSFLPQLGFGHGFIIAIITIIRALLFLFVFLNITRQGAVILKKVEFIISLV